MWNREKGLCILGGIALVSLPMVRSLRLLNFRCFGALSLELPERRGVFVGDNAQGKTSLLEAVCVLVRLHSPRARRFSHVVKFEEKGCGVAGECWGAERRVDFAGRGALGLSMEGEAVSSQSEYLASGGLLVWMGNEDVELVRGAAEGRRRFLDFVCSQLDGRYRRALGRYRRALKGRNAFLKAGDRRGVSAYTEVLIAEARVLYEVRAAVIEKLEPTVIAAQGLIGKKEREEVKMTYLSKGGDDLESALEEVSEREWRMGQTLVGPHRDDLLLEVNGMKAADFLSEGQQRTLALALKLGQGTLLREKAHASDEASGAGQKEPVFLIDDVFGELDASRRNALMAALPKESQVLVTTTSLDWLDEVGAGEWVRYEVSEGAVSKA